MASTITALVVQGATVLPDGADAAVPNGWVAAATLPDDGASTFDPTRIVLTVTDPGYDASGATIVTRTIRGTAIVRRQYPNQAQRLNSASSGTRTVYFALDDEIYAGSTVTAATAEAGYYGAAAAGSVAGIVNGSTLAYPKPLFAWLNIQQERATGSGLAVEGVAYHRHGRNGQMVARIEFVGYDGTNSAPTQTASAPALSDFQTKGQIVETYKATIPLAALTQGAICTVNAKVYPWIGDASAVLDLAADGLSWPTANPQTPLRFLCDRTGGYGGAVACVKAGVTGGSVQASLAAARATPFPTIVAALAALPAWNNTNKGHNDHSGGAIYLMDDGAGGAVNHAIGAGLAATAGSTWTDILPDPANTAAVTWDATGQRVTTSLLRWKADGRCSTTASALYGNVANASIMQAFDGITISWTAASIVPINNQIGLGYWRNVTLSGISTAPSSPFYLYGTNRQQVALALGCVMTDATAGYYIRATYAMIGCRFRKGNPLDLSRTSYPTIDSQDASVVANNMFLEQTAFATFQQSDISRGLAIVQNLFERANAASSQPAFQVAGDSTANSTRNIVIAYNSVPGVDTSGRTNIFYASNAAAVGIQRSGVARFNLFSEVNTKTDTFTNDTTLTGRTGNWKARYQVGYRGNVGIRGDTNGVTAVDPSGSNWLGEVRAADSAYGQTTISFVDDRTGASGAGGGDYRLTGSSNPAYSRVPAGLAMLKYDLRAANRRNEGSGAAGAYENEQPLLVTMTAEPGSFTLTGRAAALSCIRAMAAAPGSFALTGRPAGLQRVRTVLASSGAFALSGVAAELTFHDSGVFDPITATGAIIASAERTITPTVVPSGAANLPESGTAYSWRATFDPADRAAYAIDWSNFLGEGERIASIQNITMSAAGAALGVEIDTSAGRTPVIDAADGKIAQMWFIVDPAFQADPAFSGAGVQIAVAMKIRNDATPFEEFERTGVLQVEQL